MSDPFSLQKLLDSLGPRYTILGNEAGKEEKVTWWSEEGKALTVWHIINTKNHGGGTKDWDGCYSCEDCGMLLSKEEIDAAGKALYNKGRECHWPLPMYLAMEARGEPFYCMMRVPTFAPEGYDPGLREGDEEWVDEASGIRIVGRLNDETWKREDASQLSRDEVRLDLTDTEFEQWWWSINSNTSAWSRKALFILRWVRKELLGEATPRFIEATDAYGRKVKIPNPKWRPPNGSGGNGVQGAAGRGESEVSSEDEGVCPTCECFKPCDCPPEEDPICDRCESFKPCDCPPADADTGEAGAEDVDEDICLECGCFLPCECPPG